MFFAFLPFLSKKKKKKEKIVENVGLWESPSGLFQKMCVKSLDFMHILSNPHST